MAYSGYLIKLGSNAVEIPLKYICLDSYSVTYSTQDIDSYRDATGVLHRNVLPNRVVKVEFTTPIMRAADVMTFMSIINGAYANSSTKTVSVKWYNPESNDYKTMDCYVPDITFTIKENSPSGFIYNPVRIAFIGY